MRIVIDSTCDVIELDVSECDFKLAKSASVSSKVKSAGKRCQLQLCWWLTGTGLPMS
jgi:hypothetical protein